MIFISVKDLFYMSSRLHFHNISYIKHFQKPPWLIISGGELFHDEGPYHILQSKEVNWFLYDRNFRHERVKLNFGKVCFQFSFRLNVTLTKKSTVF